MIEERRQDKKREILSKIKPGETRRMVKNITDYGAFIDLDGLDGLLHITDMSCVYLTQVKWLRLVKKLPSVLSISIKIENESSLD